MTNRNNGREEKHTNQTNTETVITTEEMKPKVILMCVFFFRFLSSALTRTHKALRLINNYKAYYIH